MCEVFSCHKKLYHVVYVFRISGVQYFFKYTYTLNILKTSYAHTAHMKRLETYGISISASMFAKNATWLPFHSHLLLHHRLCKFNRLIPKGRLSENSIWSNFKWFP